jgi:two-component system chemotaxis sensor kinase CheA
MQLKEDDFYRELLSMFKIEAEEHIKNISSGLLDLEKSTDRKEKAGIVETVYREAHSLKGAARAVNLSDIESLCQVLESIFAKLKQQHMELSPQLFDIMHRAVDTLNDLITDPAKADIKDILKQLVKLEEGGKLKEEKSQEETEEVNETAVEESVELVAESDDHTEAVTIEETEEKAEEKNEETPTEKTLQGHEKTLLSDTVRISTKKLDSLLLEAEEMLAVKLTARQYSSDLRELVSTFDVWKKVWEGQYQDIKLARQFLEKIDKEGEDGKTGSSFYQLIEFLYWNNEYIKSLETRLVNLSKLAEGNAYLLSGMVDNLLEDMKSVLMLPFSTLLKIFPKMVRDISRDQGKNVDLLIRGSTIEVDRRILEELKDPFIHMIRNCIDHGIEKPAVREKIKKSSVATISIGVSELSGNKVEIIISDDGGGVDLEKVTQVAVKKGIIKKEEVEKLTEQEKLALIFQSDVSTSPIITEMSGRGLGMAIVREKIEKLGGMVTLETKLHVGTTFRITLPVTLATFRGILVQVGEQVFVVPTSSVERVVRVGKHDIKTVENRETIKVDDQVLSFVQLAEVLKLGNACNKRNFDFINALILEVADKRISFGVDRVINEQEVLVKDLGQQLKRVPNIAGATILGSGKVVSILNVSDLMKSAIRLAVDSTKVTLTEEGTVKTKSILIAEDSITSRTLLKNILESAGYKVRTTVDGVDAYTALKSDNYDLVVSDIEMPRMNGFDLVSKIRGDKDIAELPVVLVTALESKEDREKGIDVGANAYIVKRSFDQSNLLDVIQKLI